MRPSIGKIVHFVMPNGKHRPAIIEEVWTDNCVDLVVFIGPNDVPQALTQAWGASSVLYDGTCEPHSWHWPEREEPSQVPARKMEEPIPA